MDEAQVRLLLPGDSNALVLITSRRRLVELDSSRSVALRGLPAAEGSALFRAVAGPGRTAGADGSLSEVLELCGGLPLAIRVAAARFRARPSWTVAHLAAVLRDPARRAQVLSYEGDRIAELLGTSYRRLDPARRRSFRLLALVPGRDVDPAAAAAPRGRPRDPAAHHRDALREENGSGDSAADRYGVPGLLRDFAAGLADDADTDTAVARLLRHYEGLLDGGPLSPADEATRQALTGAIRTEERSARGLPGKPHAKA